MVVIDATACTLVTGGTGVVGQAVVRRLLAAGRRVCLTYGANSTVVEKLVAEAPGLVAVRADLRSLDIGSLLDKVVDRAGPVEALVHAAALVDHTPVASLEAEHFAEVLTVNVTAAFALARGLAKRGALRDVVLLSSIAASIADLGSVAYTTSKGATDALTRALALHLAPVRVNAVAPGIIRSHRTNGDPLFSGPSARIPDAALVAPGEVADVVFYLLDGAPDALSGQVLGVDGGVSLRRL